MKADCSINEQVEQVYRWIDSRLVSQGLGDECMGCGKCCDFRRFGHRLYVTGCETAYFASKIGRENIKLMNGGVCPYLIDGKCSVYKYRFSGCRIFNCRGDNNFQNELSEKVIRKFKQICEVNDIRYQYMEISQALKSASK
jgi:Fe-S-cluster containining protein